MKGAFLPGPGEARAALASAALFVVAFPPFALVAPGALCLTPVAVVVARAADRGAGPRAALRTGFWFGALAYGAALYWIVPALARLTILAPLAWLGAVAWLAALVALAMGMLFALRRARLPLALALPLAWCAHETMLAGLGDLAFPWLPLGLALAPVPVLAQVAELSGVRGASFLLAAFAGLAGDACLARGAGVRRIARPVAVAAVLVVAVTAFGVWRTRAVELRPLAPVAVVQPDVPQGAKWHAADRDRIAGMHAALTRRVLTQGRAALVVWPEAALPGVLADHARWRDTLRALAPLRTPILLGAIDARDDGAGARDRFNAAFLVVGDGVPRPRVHHKAALVAGIESVPFLPPRWLRAAGLPGGYARGDAAEPWTLPFGRVGALVCYESAFPGRAREQRRAGADLLVTITNDSWFGRTTAPWQHAAHIALRAIETRAPVVRAANGGISAWADPHGRVHGATAMHTADARIYPVVGSDARTLFMAAGDWVGTLSLAATAVIAAARRRES